MEISFGIHRGQQPLAAIEDDRVRGGGVKNADRDPFGSRRDPNLIRAVRLRTDHRSHGVRAVAVAIRRQ
ncbi:hypothetical protein D3C74_250170 [compost metagenome]